jgi:hypothetical protein
VYGVGFVTTTGNLDGPLEAEVSVTDILTD